METASRYEFINSLVLQGYIARKPTFHIDKKGFEKATFYVEIELDRGKDILVQSFKCEAFDKESKKELNLIAKTKKKVFVRVLGRLATFVKVSRYGKVNPQTRFIVESVQTLVITPFLLVDFKKESIPLDVKFIKEHRDEGNIYLSGEKPIDHRNKKDK